MEHKNRWLTRLDLMKLEDRMQPGSILSTGLEASVVADSIQQPQTDRVIKRIKASEEIQIVSGLSDSQALVSSPTTTRSVGTNQNQQISEKAINPSIAPVQAGMGETLNVDGREMHKQAAIQERAPDRIVTPVNVAQTGTGKVQNRVVSTGVAGDTDGGSGARVPQTWAHYDTTGPTGPNPFLGTDRVDRVNDVASYDVAGPCLGNTVTAGVIGRNGTVRIYDDAAPGALVAQLNVALVPGQRSEVQAIAVNSVTGVIYGVGSYRTALAPAGALISNFIAQWPAPTCAGPVPVSVSDPAVNGVVYPAASGLLTLLDIDYQAGSFGGFEVSAVGSMDTVSTTTSDIFIANNNATLTSPMDFTLGFGGVLHSQGLSIAMDDGTAVSTADCDADTVFSPVGVLGNRYIGAVFDSETLSATTGGASPMNLNLNADFLANECDYAWYWGAGGVNDRSFYPDPETGFFGSQQNGSVSQLSGGTEFKGAGSFLTDTDVSTIIYVDTYTGGTYLGGAFYGIAVGANYYAKRNATLLGGGMVTAGSVDNFTRGIASTLTEGDATEWDALGAPISFQSSACTAADLGSDTDGTGVAVHLTGDVSVGGRTTAPEAEWSAGGCADGSLPQPLSAVDSVYGGTGGQSATGGPPHDGYVYRSPLPLGPF